MLNTHSHNRKIITEVYIVLQNIQGKNIHAVLWLIHVICTSGKGLPGTQL